MTTTLSRNNSSTTKFIATIFTGKPTEDETTTSNQENENQEDILMSLFRDFISLIEIVLNVREGRIIPQFRTLNHSRTIIEVSFETPKPYAPSLFAKAKAIREWEGRSGVEVIFQADIPERKNKKLVVFDMDSTLIQQEVIDEIARKLGVEKEVSAITERAMNGELDFTASLHARCALLKGVPSTVFTELRDVITLTPGAKDLVHVLKRLGYKTAVLSGGFTPLTSWQAEQLKLDYAFANHLEVSPDGSTLTGIVTGDIVNAERKREHLLAIAEKEGIALEEVLAVGDGANDLQMMGVAGLGVAFNAKPKVQVEAPARLNGKSLLDVLYLLGYTEEEVEGLLR